MGSQIDTTDVPRFLSPTPFVEAATSRLFGRKILILVSGTPALSHVLATLALVSAVPWWKSLKRVPCQDMG